MKKALTSLEQMTETGFVGLHARLDLPATCLLERYVGEIVDEANMGERTDMHVFLYDYGPSKLYVDATRAGSLTRFIRKTEGLNPNMPEANCCIVPINLDGEWQLFVELKVSD